MLVASGKYPEYVFGRPLFPQYLTHWDDPGSNVTFTPTASSLGSVTKEDSGPTTINLNTPPGPTPFAWIYIFICIILSVIVFWIGMCI